MSKEYLPAGFYQCPKCNSEIRVYVPLLEAPTHRCGVGNKKSVMEFKGEKDASRNSIG